MSLTARWCQLLVVSTLTVIPARLAHANEIEVCDAAYEAAQTLRDAKKLVAARAQLRVCSRAVCPAFMVKECVGWLGELESRIPSVVLVANDTNGVAVPNVTVMMDGGSARNVDGTAWEVDPGQHSFTFAMSDGTRVDKPGVVVESIKEQRITVTFAANGSKPDFPYKTVGYAVGAAGLVGVVIGAIFGVEALATKSHDCNGGACKSGGASTAYEQGTISTVAFVFGGLLIAGGFALTLVPSAKTNAHAMSLRATPLVTSGGQGLMLQGRWW